MLVLTHRPHESLSFPVSPASVQTPPAPAAEPSACTRIEQLVQRRLDVTRLGLTELRRRLDAGQACEAAAILNNIDEDLCLLQRRLRREVEKAAPRPIPARPRQPR